MSDSRDLIDKLMKLAEPEPPDKDGWRRIVGPGDPQPLAAILREIDDTQLPRGLSFRNAKGHVLRVEAGNRRLRRVVSLDGAEAGAIEALPEALPSQPAEAELDALCEVLRAFHTDEQPVWVRGEDLAGDGRTAPAGLPAASLAQALEIDIGPHSVARLEAAFEAFVTAQSETAAAWLRFDDGALSEHSQPEPDPEWRDGWATLDLSAAQTAGAMFDDAPALIVLGSGTNGTPHHLIARRGPVSVVLRVAEADVSRIAREWRKLGL